jgi:hypothetical protein
MKEKPEHHDFMQLHLNMCVARFLHLQLHCTVLAKVSEGDPTETEAQYHKKCLNKLCRKKILLDRAHANVFSADKEIFDIALAKQSSPATRHAGSWGGGEV